MTGAIKEVEKEVVDWKDEPAKGPLFGGKVSLSGLPSAREGEEILSEEYDGYSPLVVKATRGEQKALVGDKAFQITVFNPSINEYEDFLVLIPKEVLAYFTPAPPVTMSNAEYQEHQKRHEVRRRPRVETPTALKSGPPPTQTVKK